ncbi:T-lymphocyte activation antigen CD80-like [Strongylocentrotus purpuratus]|uniref:Ig-like domain-containing protein n=1 Tax=Strongylocentrotus purpuratus TaxID=7668 RepID=A0A7M7NCB8_STRPU|nr:T-lymphocyte activation antigen CD80-like [Strongylocentrotus purpuratus]
MSLRKRHDTGIVTIAAEYEDRASLQDDNSTLILRNITVADEGTYRCVVDRQGQIAVTNTETKLNVFSLRPDTLPVITPNCTWTVDASSCRIHDNQSFNLTCTLPNVYPVEDTELIWYQDGQRVSSTDDVTQNDDGTTDISRQIQVSETGNFTCNATYLSVNVKENTAASVEAWITLSVDVTTSPGNNLKKGQIAGIIVSLVGIFLVIMILCIYIYHRKRRGYNPILKDIPLDTQPDKGLLPSTDDFDDTLVAVAKKSARTRKSTH